MHNDDTDLTTSFPPTARTAPTAGQLSPTSVVVTTPFAGGSDSRAPHRARSAVHTMALSLLADIGLPIAAYFVAELCGFSTYASLLAGAVVAALRMVWIGARERRLDPFSLFLVLIFGAGFVLTFVTGNVQFVLAKDAATSATAGLVFLGSCLIDRPLAYYAAKRFAGAPGSDEFAATARTAIMRKRWYTTSLVWGIGLLTDAALRIACIYLLSPTLAANVSQGLMVTAYTLLIGWTVHTAKQYSINVEATQPQRHSCTACIAGRRAHPCEPTRRQLGHRPNRPG